MEKFYECFFNFYGITVKVSSESSTLIELIEKDFSFFRRKAVHGKTQFNIEAHLGEIPWKKIEGMESISQSERSIVYQWGDIRFNDYHGALLSEYNYAADFGALYSPKLTRLHEELYLLILSRTGKAMDLKGLHKVHGFGIIYENKCCVVTMPMKGGKSTLLLELLKNPEVSLLSDDTPLITTSGKILPFPLRLGLEKIPEDFSVENPSENIYQIDRDEYGPKKLIALPGLRNEIGGDYSGVFLIEGQRIRSSSSSFEIRGWWKTFNSLVRHGVIGIGLPMILEYFWQKGFEDFFVKTKIFLSRLWGFINLSLRAKSYTFKMGYDPQSNAQKLLEFLRQK